MDMAVASIELIFKLSWRSVVALFALRQACGGGVAILLERTPDPQPTPKPPTLSARRSLVLPCWHTPTLSPTQSTPVPRQLCSFDSLLRDRHGNTLMVPSSTPVRWSAVHDGVVRVAAPIPSPVRFSSLSSSRADAVLRWPVVMCTLYPNAGVGVWIEYADDISPSPPERNGQSPLQDTISAAGRELRRLPSPGELGSISTEDFAEEYQPWMQRVLLAPDPDEVKHTANTAGGWLADQGLSLAWGVRTQFTVFGGMRVTRKVLIHPPTILSSGGSDRGDTVGARASDETVKSSNTDGRRGKQVCRSVADHLQGWVILADAVPFCQVATGSGAIAHDSLWRGGALAWGALSRAALSAAISYTLSPVSGVVVAGQRVRTKIRIKYDLPGNIAAAIQLRVSLKSTAARGCSEAAVSVIAKLLEAGSWVGDLVGTVAGDYGLFVSVYSGECCEEPVEAVARTGTSVVFSAVACL